MNITKITIITGLAGTDCLMIETDLPEPIWPYEGVLTLKTEVAKGKAEDYVKDHFPSIEVECIRV